MPSRDSIQKFLGSYKTTYPKFAQMPDDQLIAKLITDYPGMKEQLTPTEATFGDNLITGGLRVGGAVLGSVGGAIAGGVGGLGVGAVPGSMAGGALGAGAGESLAELYEKVRGLRSSLNPAQIATQAGLGAIPVKGIGAGASILKAAGLHGAQGAAMGGVATTATKLAEDGSLPSLGQLASGVGAGAVAGGAIGAYGAKLAPKKTVSAIPEFRTLQEQRELAAAPSTLKEDLKALPSAVRERYSDSSEALLRDQRRTGHFPATPAQDPHKVMAVAKGGTGGIIRNIDDDYKAVIKEAEQLGISQELNDYVQAQGFLHTDWDLKNKAINLLKAGQTALPDPKDLKAGHEMLAKIQSKEHLPTVGGVGTFDDVKLKGFVTAIENSPKGPEVKRLAKVLFDRQKAALQEGANEGNISQASAAEMLSRGGGEYAPLPRIMGDDIATRDLSTHALDLAQPTVIKKRLGSGRTNVDVIQAMAEREAHWQREIARNRMGRSYVQLRQTDPILANHLVEMKDGMKPRPGYGTVSYLDNGKPVTFEVPKDVADVFDNAKGQGDFPGEMILRGVGNLAKTFMTALNPAFLASNVLADIQDARKLFPGMKQFHGMKPNTWLSGPADFAKFGVEWAQSLREVMKNGPGVRRFRAAGADMSGFQQNLTPELFNGEKAGTAYDMTVGRLARLSGATETATKLATFNRATKPIANGGLGLSDFEAAVLVRDLGGSPDYAVKGTYGRHGNALVQFFTAQAAGTARNLRFLSSPARVSSLFASATVAATALHAYNRQFVDPDGTLALDKVTDQDKQLNWIIIRPETYTTSEGDVRHRYVKIKKGHLNRLIHNPLEETIKWAWDNYEGKADKDASVLQLPLDALSNIIPGSVNLKKNDPVGSLARGAVSSLNPALKIPLEWWANKDTYRDIPIESKRLQGVGVTERKTSRTSHSMGVLSKMLDEVGIAKPTGASPQKLQHALASVAPGLGEAGVQILDMASGKQPSNLPLEGDEKWSRMPVAGFFNRRFVGTSNDQVENDQFGRFYDLQAASDEATKTFTILSQRDRVQAREFLADPENKLLIALNPTMIKLSKVLSEIRAAKEQLAVKAPDDQGEKLRRLGRVEAQVLGRIDAALARVQAAKK